MSLFLYPYGGNWSLAHIDATGTTEVCLLIDKQGGRVGNISMDVVCLVSLDVTKTYFGVRTSPARHPFLFTATADVHLY